MSKLTIVEIDNLLENSNLQRIEEYVGAGKPIKCSCRICGKIVFPRISMIKQGHSGCKFCASKKGAYKRKLNPDVAREIMISAGVEPLEPYLNLKNPWLSRCIKCGNHVTPSLGNVKQGHLPCKYCSGNAISIEKATLIYLQSGAKPTDKFPGVNKKWKGICLNCNSKVSPRLSDIQRGQGPCKKCGYSKSSQSNKLSEKIAVQRMIDAGAEPIESWDSVKNNESPWLCVCLKCNSIITPTLHSITNGQGPCIHCGRKIAREKNKLSHNEATEIIKRFNFEPLEEYVSANTNWLTKCLRCGDESRRTFANIQFGYGCRKCTYKERQITNETAFQEMKNRGWEPLVQYEGASTPWKCKCLKCGEISYKRLYSIGYESRSGCRICGERILSSVIYLINHQILKSYKIGVGGKRRMDEHLAKGWEIIKTWDVQNPVLAYQIEGEVLEYIRNIWELPQFLSKNEMPQNGATETFSSYELESLKVIKLIENLMNDSSKI